MLPTVNLIRYDKRRKKQLPKNCTWIAKIGVSDEMADRIIETYEKVLKLKGDFSIKDAVEIELSMDRKYKEKELDSNGG